MSRRWKAPLRGSEEHEVHEKLGELEKALPFHEHYDDVRFIAADYTMDPPEDFTDHYTVDATGAINLTFPDGRLYVGRPFNVTRVAGAAAINCISVGGQLFNGAASPFVIPNVAWVNYVFKAVYGPTAGAVNWIAMECVA